MSQRDSHTPIELPLNQPQPSRTTRNIVEKQNKIQLWVIQKFSQVVTAGTAWPQTSLLWGFSTVETKVTLQMAICSTWIVTEVTAVGLLSSVDPSVNCEMASLAKGFTTEVTAVGLLSGVDLHVLFWGYWMRKGSSHMCHSDVSP